MDKQFFFILEVSLALKGLPAQKHTENEQQNGHFDTETIAQITRQKKHTTDTTNSTHTHTNTHLKRGWGDFQNHYSLPLSFSDLKTLIKNRKTELKKPKENWILKTPRI